MPLKVEEEKARAEGARGYLPKSLDWERLVSAIRIAAKDGDFIADDFDEPKVGPLSRREIDVLTYIAQGKTHEEIGIIGAAEEAGLQNPLTDARVQDIAAFLDRQLAA